MPSLNSLRTFESAARHGSFKRAADELFVTHSAVSHQVKQLEQALGVELFIRRPRSVELTRAGRYYYPLLRDAFDRIAEATDLVLNSHTHSTLTIQVYSTFAIRWLIPRLALLSQTHPDLKPRLVTSQTDVDFEKNDVDACVLIGQCTDEQLRYDYLFSSRVFPVCSPSMLESHSIGDDPSKLADMPILQVYPSLRDWWVWLEQNDVKGVDPDAGQQFDSYDLAMNSSMQGIGVALGMEPFVNRDLEAGLLVEPYADRRTYLPEDWYLVCREEKANYPDIVSFREWLLDQVASDTSIPPRH
jgi:LysR family glycine cleavage system transcriptional activator